MTTASTGVSAEEAMSEANVSAKQPQEVQEARLSTSDVDPRRPSHPEGPSTEGPSPAVGLIQPIRDRATFENPNQLSEGMEYVLVNGVPVIDNGKQTEALPGRVLRGPAYVSTN